MKWTNRLTLSQPLRIQKYNCHQCDQMTDFVLNIWPFTAMKLFPKAYKLCQTELKLCPNPHTTYIYCQRFLNIGQSGEISPNFKLFDGKISYSVCLFLKILAPWFGPLQISLSLKHSRISTKYLFSISIEQIIFVLS